MLELHRINTACNLSADGYVVRLPSWQKSRQVPDSSLGDFPRSIILPPQYVLNFVCAAIITTQIPLLCLRCRAERERIINRDDIY